jgi:hydrogenase maturation factor
MIYSCLPSFLCVWRSQVRSSKPKTHKGSASGRVQFGGITRSVRLDFVPEAVVGDYVMVHVGFAMIAINSAVQVDLTGQVCSDSIGNQFYSGIGGQVDFLRGASCSKGGKRIIAISSTPRAVGFSPHLSNAESGSQAWFPAAWSATS